VDCYADSQLRRRGLSLRLSKDEYQELAKQLLVKGARSASELAREAICQFLAGSQSLTGKAATRHRIDHLEGEARRLSRGLGVIVSFAKE